MLLLINILFILFSTTPPSVEPSEWYDKASWESKRVNPYIGRQVSLPNQVAIDCTSFYHPSDGVGRVSDKYGWRSKVNRMHRGVDIALPLKTPILSSWSGVVRVVGYEPKGYGRFVVIRHNNGLETIYAHLSSAIVVRNDKVKAGSLIGYSGNTGRSSGPHLHFETRFLGGDFNPSLIIDFGNHVARNDFFVWTKSLYPKRRSNVPLHTYRLTKDCTLEELCEEKGWDLEETCLGNGLLPDMELAKGRLIRIIK